MVYVSNDELRKRDSAEPVIEESKIVYKARGNDETPRPPTAGKIYRSTYNDEGNAIKTEEYKDPSKFKEKARKVLGQLKHEGGRAGRELVRSAKSPATRKALKTAGREIASIAPRPEPERRYSSKQRRSAPSGDFGLTSIFGSDSLGSPLYGQDDRPRRNGRGRSREPYGAPNNYDFMGAGNFGLNNYDVFFGDKKKKGKGKKESIFDF